MENQTQSNSWFNFGNIFEYCLLALVFFVPIIFLPSVSVSLYSMKIALLATLIVVFIGTFLANTLSSGIINFPKSKLLIPIALFPLIALLSSFFSGAILKSSVGVVFEMGTSGSFVILTMLLFLAILAIKEDAMVGVKTIYAFLFSSLFVVLHLIVRAFGASLLPQVIATRIPNFLLGGSIDTSIFLGAVVIAAISALHMLSLNNRARYIAYGLIVLSMIFIGAVAFTPIIIVAGLFALVYFVYIFSWTVGSGESTEHKKGGASLPSLFVLAISVVFILSGGGLSGYLSKVFNLNSIEVRPNVETTVNLVGNAWKKNPALGVGTNMFAELWDMYRPADVNSTQFWAAEFNTGSSFLLTVAATTGPLGLLALLSFLVLYVRAGFKAIFSSNTDSRFRYVSSTSFFVSLFFWVMALVYSPGLSILALTFIFTGIFIGTLVPQGVVQNMQVNIFRNPKANFASVFLIVVLLISSIAGGYFVWERVVAASIFQRGDANGALRLVQTDIYWRTFSGNALNQIGTTISSVASVDSLTETQKASIQSSISDAVEGARQAIAWNPKNYQNWFALGRIYEVLAANGIEGGVENAKTAFNEAQTRSPQNPAVPLAFARISALSSDLEGARGYIAKAIEMKNNYTDAYFTLAQLEAATNNVEGAIRSVEAATFVDPQNATLYFQLGLLKYNNEDYRGAANAFAQAVTLVPDYANARYFLGLSYERLDRTSDAITQFEEILKTNPDNAEVNLILSNLKAGKSPFANATPPIDDKPEDRPELPVDE